MGMVIDPRLAYNAVRDSSSWVVEMPPVLCKEHQRLIEEPSIYVALNAVGSVVRDHAADSFVRRDGTSLTVEELD